MFRLGTMRLWRQAMRFRYNRRRNRYRLGSDGIHFRFRATPGHRDTAMLVAGNLFASWLIAARFAMTGRFAIALVYRSGRLPAATVLA